MVSVLFGLSMDYQVFLVSRMYEEWLETGDNRRAVRVGLAETSRVINSAAVIMISVFLAFVLSGDRVIAMFGIALAAAVALDAFVLRTLLVPALMHLLGGANWWLPALARPAAAAHQHRAARVPRRPCEDPCAARERGRRSSCRTGVDGSGGATMFAISLGDDGAELRPLEPWQAEEFLAHMDRGRDFIGQYIPLRPPPRTRLGARASSSVRRQARRRHRLALRHLARRHARRRGALPELRRRAGQLRGRLLAGARRRGPRTGHPRRCGCSSTGRSTSAGSTASSGSPSAGNTASLNVARRLGMTRDGVLRARPIPYRGVRHDMEVWSVLAPEWRDARARAAHSDH